MLFRLILAGKPSGSLISTYNNDQGNSLSTKGIYTFVSISANPLKYYYVSSIGDLLQTCHRNWLDTINGQRAAGKRANSFW